MTNLIRRRKRRQRGVGCNGAFNVSERYSRRWSHSFWAAGPLIKRIRVRSWSFISHRGGGGGDDTAPEQQHWHRTEEDKLINCYWPPPSPAVPLLLIGISQKHLLPAMRTKLVNWNVSHHHLSSRGDIMPLLSLLQSINCWFPRLINWNQRNLLQILCLFLLLLSLGLPSKKSIIQMSTYLPTPVITLPLSFPLSPRPTRPPPSLTISKKPVSLPVASLV